MNVQELAKTIDNTQLKPYTTRAHITSLCARARKYKFASVCINPCYVTQATKELEGSGVQVCAVVGFPLGAATTRIKTLEAKEALECGASEIDFVLNIGNIKTGNKKEIEKEIYTIVNSLKQLYPCTIKSIIETCLLTKEEKILACESAVKAGIDYVKTSTGFSTEGAKHTDIKLLKKITGTTVKIKAAGGIKTLDTALKMLQSGADRLGTSSGEKIMQEQLTNILNIT
ncbi:MAG: deoxyribose-phosphate aldolase [Clostridiales bacterium]|nr:deoxyribose-phosphate aldolase [Clostridiales bacterium]MCF8021990.1 deoxyribose-phosphate aldolase [Clostridiales bacterium]